MSKLLKQLASAGLIESFRGVNGGYRLAREPARISIADIVIAMEGPIGMTECSAQAGLCDHESHCGVRVNWKRINDAIAGALAGGEPITEALSLEAAQLAAQRRSDLIDQGRSFVAETVFSHPSKVDNSRLRTPFQVLARYTDGRGQVSPSASWPRWVPPELHPDNVCH